MSRVPLTNWLNKTLPYLPGCTEPIAQDKIREAAIEFCERSWAHNIVLEQLPLTANVPELEFADFIDSDCQARVHKVLEATLNRETLTPLAIDDCRRHFGADWQQRTGVPEAYVQTGATHLRLVPYPAQSQPKGLWLKVAMKPQQDATEVHDELWEEYAMAIAEGALAKLYLMGKKPWTNPEAAGIAAAKFEDAITKTKKRVQRGFNRSRATTRGVYF